MRRILLAALPLLLLPIAYPAAASNCAGTSTGMVPLSELGTGTYQGYEGGLYPGGASERPAGHTARGLTLAQLVVPRNALGLPDPALGKIVLLSIGMSNTRNESGALAPKIKADPLRDPSVVFVNGAQGGMDAERTKTITSPYWPYVDQQLAVNGVTAFQVQAVWLKQAIAGGGGAFPQGAEKLRDDLRAIVQILKLKFPHLNLVYPSSRIYAGYASTGLNPEPYAYESGFAVKWLIEEQLFAGDAGLPWLSWAAYPWADGLRARADGLIWECDDFNADGTHPSAKGSTKVADLLMDWLHADPTALIWYERAR